MMAAIGDRSLVWFGAERAAEARAAAAASPDVTTLVREYSGLLYRVAFSVVRSSAEAEDVVQDTFVRVLQQGERLAGVVEMRPWLVRIAWNLGLDRRRRVRPEQMDEVLAGALISAELPADQALDEATQMRRVLAEMERLPAKERQVLLLSAMEELSSAEIGSILGRSESSVRSLLFRARERLKKRLGERGGRG